MPTPSLTLTFRKILEAPGNYASQYEDISRRGTIGHTFKYTGTRGNGAVLTCIQFFTDRAAAVAAISQYEAAQGLEAMITNTLDQWTRQVFVNSVWAFPPERVESTEPNITYRVRVRIEVLRTA